MTRGLPIENHQSSIDNPGAVLGLDVGGANLKAAHSNGTCRSRPFALWRNPSALPQVLAELLRELPSADELAVTMTGELCDCFATKRAGVHAILDAVESAAGGKPVWVWRSDGRLVDLVTARLENALPIAAANWLALATWAGRLVPSGSALLIDAGTTTTDIVPLLDGVPMPAGRTDPERLRNGELVYTGVRRTPVCALGGPEFSLAAEWFATTHDVYLVLGLAAEDPSNNDTADGRPATREYAHARLARMLGADLETSTAAERLALATQVSRRQAEVIGRAVRTVASRLPAAPGAIVLAGVGEFLTRRALNLDAALASARVRSVRQEARGAAFSQAACAYAVAVLRQERRLGGAVVN